MLGICDVHRLGMDQQGSLVLSFEEEDGFLGVFW